MRRGQGFRYTLARHALGAAAAVLGVVAIVGSGGGSIDPPSSGNSGSNPSSSYPLGARIFPSRLTVQVGATVVFRAVALSEREPPTYQWRRDGVDIVGANAATYTLVGANLGDDGVRFAVEIAASNGTATATGLLRVSRLPGIAYEDGDFPTLDWSVAIIADPADPAARFAVSTDAAGGKPDVYRRTDYSMPPGPGSLTVLQSSSAATYKPAESGEILVIDFTFDCSRTDSTLNSLLASISAAPLLEQDGRRFTASPTCACAPGWFDCSISSLVASEFAQVDGPACRPNETCPDFSFGGRPLRLGFAVRATSQAGMQSFDVSTGLDNWKATVWRN